jgi:hypothetical protein
MTDDPMEIRRSLSIKASKRTSCAVLLCLPCLPACLSASSEKFPSSSDWAQLHPEPSITFHSKLIQTKPIKSTLFDSIQLTDQSINRSYNIAMVQIKTAALAIFLALFANIGEAFSPSSGRSTPTNPANPAARKVELARTKVETIFGNEYTSMIDSMKMVSGGAQAEEYYEGESTIGYECYNMYVIISSWIYY